MSLSTLDWSIIVLYLVFALGVGIFYAKRASRSAEEYYLAGRTLPWWVLGTSMVATTFAADTPLAITEYLRVDGIWKNWFWWNWLLSGLLGVFLFSRLWRRSGVLTDNEILELRYSGKPAAFLRGYKAIHFGIIFNLIVMGWVLESMSSVLAVTMGLEKNTAMWGLVAIALAYALLSGFWGVVVTDVVQFVIAMGGPSSSPCSRCSMSEECLPYSRNWTMPPPNEPCFSSSWSGLSRPQPKGSTPKLWPPPLPRSLASGTN